MTEADLNKHYVYIYRTRAGKPLYVGYGARAVRSAAHLGIHAHNARLTNALEERDYTLEIAGPFGSKEMAIAVETALISAFNTEKTLCNVNRGPQKYRFRAMGVPSALVGRLDPSPLTGHDLSLHAAKTNGIIMVNINDLDLGDGREGDLLVDVPDDDKIAQRVDRWWRLYGYASREWSDQPKKSPRLLLGIAGRGEQRMILASIRIDKDGWAKAITESLKGGLLRIPHDEQNLDGLDYRSLRGRRIDLGEDLRFGRFNHEVFMVLDNTGTVVKGGRKGD